MARLQLLARLLALLSWRDARHHAARLACGVAAVALGVALACAVQLINDSALAEFGSAVRSVDGEPDLQLLARTTGGFDEALYARVAADPRVMVASPIVELEVQALGTDGRRHRLRLVGADALVAPALAPTLAPQPAAGEERLAAVDPSTVFLNPAARQVLGVAPGASLALQSGLALRTLRVAGSVTAPGAPLALVDLAGAQALFGRLGRLDRIDLRLTAGTDAAELAADWALPPEVRAAPPGEAEQRLANVSRAYRVNLTVLALVALFTGTFLVFSILSLSVAQRLPQLALLGVLGLDARDRQALVLAESALIGLVGSVLGVALGAALAWTALHALGGDLGGGYFAGVAPPLRFDAGTGLLYGALGTAAALIGGWWPAREAAAIAPAQALKGLGSGLRTAPRAAPGLGLIAAGALLALAPPIAGLPLAAYLSVALLLIGGIACVPVLVGLMLAAVRGQAGVLGLLAVERARQQRATATVAVAGVVASLALAVALTVMVGSFRGAVTVWLDRVLPADLYLRTASGAASGSAWLPPDFVAAAAAVPGVASVQGLRALPVALPGASADLPAPVLIARPIADPQADLPLTGALRPAPPGETAVYASEALAALHGATPGRHLELLLPRPQGGEQRVTVYVRGLWRDYARQHGALVMAQADYRALTGDERINDLALTLAPGVDAAAVQQRLRALAPEAALLEFASAGEIRALSLRIFDRSFAVTYWLQAVAVGIGLFGIAASFSAQVLARRKEFGVLAHLGFTRREVLAIVAGEGAAWTAAGALLGLALGVAVSVVLVHVVNPQSFHWTMELLLPWGRLAALCAAVL
ncbi:MAG TPA: ABC transporter permease, partial [Methylibium sp.]|nr:ABC transporter permease [Methylibium sp.]